MNTQLPWKNLIKDEVIMEKNKWVHVANNLIYIIHIIFFYNTSGSKWNIKTS